MYLKWEAGQTAARWRTGRGVIRWRLMTFDGIIFDFNGVLLWDSPWQEAAWQAFAAEIRPERPFTPDEMAIHVHGRPNRHTIEFLLGRALSADELAACVQRKEALYRAICLRHPDQFRLSPGAESLLDCLVARAIPHTIATASGRGNLDFFIHHLQLARWFDLAQIVYDDGRLPGKPAPDVYLEAARRLGLPPARCVVVEDAVSGLQAAAAAGIGHLIALGPPTAQAKLAALPGVQTVVESLAQVRAAALFGRSGENDAT